MSAAGGVKISNRLGQSEKVNRVLFVIYNVSHYVIRQCPFSNDFSSADNMQFIFYVLV